jgi:hypothetical protein
MEPCPPLQLHHGMTLDPTDMEPRASSGFQFVRGVEPSDVRYRSRDEVEEEAKRLCEKPNAVFSNVFPDDLPSGPWQTIHDVQSSMVQWAIKRGFGLCKKVERAGAHATRGPQVVFMCHASGTSRGTSSGRSVGTPRASHSMKCGCTWAIYFEETKDGVVRFKWRNEHTGHTPNQVCLRVITCAHAQTSDLVRRTG